MKDVQDIFTKLLLLGCSLAVLLLLGYAAYKENFAADWYRHQREYKNRLIEQATSEPEREAAQRFDVGQKQLYLPALNRIDRCVTCHVAIDNPSMSDAPQPLTAHSGEIMQNHPKETFGCTICHEGQGRATTAADAHGHVHYWPEPMLAQEQLDRSCPKCHTDRWLPEVSRYNAAMDLFYEHGCLTCHRLRGRGGDIGPDISRAGEIHDAEWHFKHFKDPKSVVETSEMPNENLSDDEAQRLTFLMMCYQGQSIPTELLPDPAQEVAQMKLPEPLDPLALEGFVGSEYCISCHGATHPGAVETWRDSKMATTYERIKDEPVKDNCLPCHSTGLNSETGHFAEEGVGCEGCHGPGREAVRLILASKPEEHKQLIQIDQNSEPICERCHNPHVPTAKHAEFYRKLPPQGLSSVAVASAAVEDEQEKARPAVSMSPAPAQIPEPSAPMQEPAELPVEDAPPMEQKQSAHAAITEPEPHETETDAEQKPPAVAQTEPNIVSTPVVTEAPPVAERREPNLPLVMPEVQVPESFTMPVIDALYGTAEVQPPEKIEGGCVSVMCHPATILGKVVHGPTAQQDCQSCHRLVDEPSHKFEPISDEADLCYECHDPSSMYEFQHGPVALGICTVCHNPHSGPQEFMLPETGNNLCFVCHTDMREHVHTVHIQHEVIAEEGCTACHDPHASDYDKQLIQDMPTICLDCHEQVGEIIETAIVTHDPVTKENKCANCHAPHGGDVPGLLTDQEITLCLDCHDEPLETANGTIIDMKTWLENNPERHGPIREGSCTLCHQPHGSQHFRILTHEFPRKFYSPFSVEVYDLCFQCHEATLVLDEKTTALTDFRNGNKNLHYIHVNKERGRTCRACHEVHAGTKSKRMKDFVPYGSWMYPVNFDLAENGGKCAPGCHLPRAYNREQQIIQR